MRMRKKKHLDERTELCSAVNLGNLTDPVTLEKIGNPVQPINIREVFGNDNPLRMEIGCGKGRFADKIARLNPNVNFIAVEKTPNVVISAMERSIENGTKNLKYITGLAEYLTDVIPPKSVEVLYLNFSCPYPKGTYARHRLTHKRFLDIYREILTDNGIIRQKTDNMALFEFSLQSLTQNGFVLNKVSLDLHKSDVEGNIMTEYEEKFSSEGLPIYYLEAALKSGNMG